MIKNRKTKNFKIQKKKKKKSNWGKLSTTPSLYTTHAPQSCVTPSPLLPLRDRVRISPLLKM